MKIFVTGATGFVGREIVRQAHAGGHSLRILARQRESQSLAELTEGADVEVHPGDLLEPVSLDGALDGIQAIIHLVGIISEVGKSTFENVHVGATANLLAAAQRSEVRRFVHMSALGTRPDAVARYHQTKWDAEEAVRKSGLAFTIFRPSLIFGPRDHFVNLFAKMARFSPVLPVMASPRVRFQAVAVDMVARAFVRSLEEPRSIGQTYDLCGSERFTFAELLDQIMAASGRNRLKLQVPLGLARVQAACLERIYRRLLGQPAPFSRDQLTMLQEDNTGQGTPANELFGLKHESFGAGIRRYVGRKT